MVLFFHFIFQSTSLWLLYWLLPLCQWYTAVHCFWCQSLLIEPHFLACLHKFQSWLCTNEHALTIHQKLNSISLPYYLNKLYNIKFYNTLIIQNPFFTTWCNFRWKVSFDDHITGNQGCKTALLPFKMIKEFISWFCTEISCLYPSCCQFTALYCNSLHNFFARFRVLQLQKIPFWSHHWNSPRLIPFFLGGP